MTPTLEMSYITVKIRTGRKSYVLWLQIFVRVISVILGDRDKYSGHTTERFQWFTFGPVPRVQQGEHDMISRRSFGH